MSSTILVVEDNPANMKLATTLLAKSGYRVLQASDAGAGLALARARRPELILMDIQLPGRDGLTATRELKQDPHLRHIKVIALTAFAMKGDEDEARGAGCDGYITKPYRYRDLLEAVERALSERRQEER
jgi:two-component system cell cycle response regulator DivK